MENKEMEEFSKRWVDSLNNMGYGKIASLKNAGEEKKGIFLGTTKDFSVAELNKLDLLNMEKNEIKKALYKQNPEAKFLYAKKGNLYYGTQIPALDGVGFSGILFTIPFSDLGDAEFLPEMDAKLLIRWIV